MTVNSQASPLLKYHPVRFFVLRDEAHWSKYSSSELNTDESFLMSAMPVAKQIDNFRKSIFDYVAKNIPDDSLINDIYEYSQEAMALESEVIEWDGYGRHIFDLSGALKKVSQLDTNAVNLQKLKLPVDKIYIHWGAEAKIDSPGEVGQFIDGCYFRIDRESDEDTIHFMFTSTFPSNFDWKTANILSNYIADIRGVESMMETLEMASNYKAIMFNYLNQESTDPLHILRWKKYIPQALSMAVRCLGYIQDPRNNGITTFPPGAPEDLVQIALSDDKYQSFQASNKLDELGYRRVHILS